MKIFIYGDSHIQVIGSSLSKHHTSIRLGDFVRRNIYIIFIFIISLFVHYQYSLHCYCLYCLLIIHILIIEHHYHITIMSLEDEVIGCCRDTRIPQLISTTAKTPLSWIIFKEVLKFLQQMSTSSDLTCIFCLCVCMGVSMYVIHHQILCTHCLPLHCMYSSSIHKCMCRPNWLLHGKNRFHIIIRQEGRSQQSTSSLHHQLDWF